MGSKDSLTPYGSAMSASSFSTLTEFSKISFSSLVQISLVTVGTTMIYGLPICWAISQPKVNSSTSFFHSSGVQKLIFSMELNANGLRWLLAKNALRSSTVWVFR